MNRPSLTVTVTRIVMSVVTMPSPSITSSPRYVPSGSVRTDQPETTDPEGRIVVQGQREKKICHTESSTGSIMQRRVCRTPTEIAQNEARARAIMEGARQDMEMRRHIQENR